MSYRLVAMDLDETLLNEDLQISERNYRAIQAARDHGIIVTIATGRMYRSCLPYARQLKLDVPFITYHGALVRSVEGAEPLFYYPLDYVMARDIVATAEKLNYHVNLYLDEQVYVREENQFSRLYQSITAVDVHPVGNLSSYLEKACKNPAKLTMINYEDQQEEMDKYLQENYHGKINITKSHSYFMELTHLRATKGQALKTLADCWEIEPSEVVAIGDSYNDLDMIQYAGLGVAMSNARQELRENADMITASYNEDGVAEVLENLI